MGSSSPIFGVKIPNIFEMPPRQNTSRNITKSSPFNWWWFELIEKQTQVSVQPGSTHPNGGHSILMTVRASRWFLLLSGVLKGSWNGFNWRLIRLTCPKRRISQDWKSKGIVTTCYDGKDCEQKGVVWRCLHEFSFEAKTNCQLLHV